MGVNHLTVFVGQGTVAHAGLTVESSDRADNRADSCLV